MGRPRAVNGTGERPPVTLRPARREDADRLREWRNDPVAVAYSVTGEAVSPAEHASWVAARLDDPDTRLWIAEEGSVPVGQVRVDIRGTTGTVSIAVAAEHRGRGLAVAMLLAMIEALSRSGPVDRLEALADPRNIASVQAFRHAGFGASAVAEDGFIRLHRDLAPTRAENGL